MDSQDLSTPALILKTGDTDINKITPITNSPFLIGRGMESSFKLRQKSISRKQCSIERNGTNWAIRSLGSRPITVNDSLVFEDSLMTLKCSDVIELPGAIKFEFRCSPDQNGRCCENSEPNNRSILCLNDSSDFAVPSSRPSTSTQELSLNSSPIDKPSSDCSLYMIEEVQSFNTDDLININTSTTDPVPLKSVSVGASKLGLLLEIDKLTEVILMFANHLKESEVTGVVYGNYSRLSDELRLRLEFSESIDMYGIDESCKAHERNGNITSLMDAVKTLSSTLDKIRIDSSIKEKAMGTRFNENMELIFLSIDVALVDKAEELVNVLNKLPNSSKTVTSNDFPAFSESKVSRICSCKQRNRKVMNRKRKEPISADVNDIDYENEVQKKLKWQEAKIEFLQMKLKQKENVSNELESAKEENDMLVNKVAELKRSLADKDIMELEFRVLQESVKYKEEDKRSKDILQERIDSLQSESTNLKNENETLVADLEKVKNEIAEMMEKYKKLNEKFNEKMNSSTALGSLKDGNTNEDQCCELGGAKTSSLMELIERELNCSICGEMFIEATVTNCNHAFCTHCLKEWKKMKRECPFCRTIVVKECKISFLDEFINNLLKLFSPKMLDERLNLIQERLAPPVEPPPAKRPRARAARQTARVTRNSRGAQNPPVPMPFYVDPRIINFP